MADALYTHHHYGWRRHDFPNSHLDHLHAALIEAHDFLAHYEGMYRIEVERTPACSFDGKVHVFWDADNRGEGRPLRKGDHWFEGFEFNVAPDDACRFCGGTGMDHYIGPFGHCWACDGTAKQIREKTWRGFMNKPTKHASSAFHDQYAEYLRSIEADHA